MTIHILHHFSALKVHRGSLGSAVHTSCWKRTGFGCLSLSLYSTLPSSSSGSNRTASDVRLCTPEVIVGVFSCFNDSAFCLCLIAWATWAAFALAVSGNPASDSLLTGPLLGFNFALSKKKSLTLSSSYLFLSFVRI